jgi:2-dehydro-3-deoxygluconokinase
VVAAYPGLQVVGTTLREVTSGLVNNWSAVLYQGGRCYRSRRYQDLAIEDRVGGGDGFSAGLIYGLLEGMAPEDCVELAAAHGALVQSTRGDTSMVTLAEVKSLLGGRTARIDR